MLPSALQYSKLIVPTADLFFLNFFNSILFLHLPQQLSDPSHFPIYPTFFLLKNKIRKTKQNKPHEKQKTKKRLIRTKCAPTNQPSKIKKNSPRIPLCLLCVGQLLMGPALECAPLTAWLGVTPCVLGSLSDLTLHRPCVCHHSLCKFTRASVLFV